MNTYQYYKKIPSKFFEKVLTISFGNKTKIQWEQDNLIKREKKT